jgi:hypothetical protein
MNPSILRRSLALAALLALSALPAAAQRARFEVVGRAPVTRTRTTGLAVFRGVDGRDYAYAGTFGQCPACVAGRMYAWDVTDPARPRLTDSVMVDARIINGVAVNAAGTLAAFTREGAESRRNGLVVLDLKDPAHPRVAADYWETLTGGAHAVAMDGNFAYVVDQGSAELAVIDLTDPADPREVGRWGVPNTPGRFLQDVAVKDGLAYLAYWNDGLAILDVGNGVKGGTPSRPRLVSQYRYRTEWRGDRYGNTASVFPFTTAAGKRYLLVGDQILSQDADLNRRLETGGMVHVLNVTDPEVPTEVATYAGQNGVHASAAAGETLYAASWNGGLRAVDLSGEIRGDLRSRELAALATGDSAAYLPNLPFAWSVVPHNGLVFASDFNSGLWIARIVPAAAR